MNLDELYRYLLSTADTLDQWAAQSIAGGWSTHQVSENQRLADDMRRKASQLLKLQDNLVESLNRF